MTIMQLNAGVLMLNCLIYLVATNTYVHIDCCDKISCFCNYIKKKILTNMPVFHLLYHMLYIILKDP